MSMPEEAQGRFEPLHSGHAIEQVMVGLLFGQEATDTDLVNADRVLTPLAVGAKRSEIRAASFMIGVDVPAAAGAPPSLAGYTFGWYRPDGSLEYEFRAERAGLFFRTTAYSRWAGFVERTAPLLRATLPVYCDGSRPVSNIGLTYVDKFRWNGPQSKERLQDLFRLDSKYLPSHIFETQELWHSHTGVFDLPARNIKRLLRLNIDYVDENTHTGPMRVAGIQTAVANLYNQPQLDRTIVARDGCYDFFKTGLDELHAFSKSALGNLLTDTMAKRIELMAPP